MDLLGILLDSFWDTVSLLPFLFVAYFVLEYVEHKSQSKLMLWVRRFDSISPLIWAGMGLFPHCAFSAVASSFYATRMISLGTLFSVFLATSDEMVPIFLSNGVSVGFVLKILFVKFIIAVCVGFLLDLFIKRGKASLKIREFCDCQNCHCDDGILFSAFRHTVKIFVLIFVVAFIFGVIVSVIGEERIAMLFSDSLVSSKFIVALIGLVPNCASSVILSKLYLSGVISYASLISGVLVGAGFGLIVLFKMNKNLKENLFIVFSLYLIAVFLGIMLEFIC